MMNATIRDIHYMDARFGGQKAQFKIDTSQPNYEDWNIFESWLIGHGRKLPTVLKQLGAFKRVLRLHYCADMKGISRNELIELNRKIVESSYKTSTKINMQLFMRSFLNLFADDDRKKEIKSVLKIMQDEPDDNPESDEEGKVISYHDFKLIHRSMPNNELGTMVKILFSTGMRVTELYNIRPDNVQFIYRTFLGIRLPPALFGYKCAWIYTRGKRTKSKRDGRYMYYMALFVDDFHKFLEWSDDGYTFNYSYSYFLQSLHEAVRIEKIPYRVHPHMFRHTAATRLFKVHTDAMVKKIMNWSKNSNMPKHYSHINKSDIVEAMDKVKKY